MRETPMISQMTKQKNHECKRTRDLNVAAGTNIEPSSEALKDGAALDKTLEGSAKILSDEVSLAPDNETVEDEVSQSNTGTKFQCCAPDEQRQNAK